MATATAAALPKLRREQVPEGKVLCDLLLDPNCRSASRSGIHGGETEK